MKPLRTDADWDRAVRWAWRVAILGALLLAALIVPRLLILATKGVP